MRQRLALGSRSSQAKSCASEMTSEKAVRQTVSHIFLDDRDEAAP